MPAETWREETSGEALMLDTGSWMITAGSLEAKIDRWEVNQDTCKMRIASEQKKENFIPLDYGFAVSMIGQTGSKSHLASYLISLGEIYMMQDRTDIPSPEKEFNEPPVKDDMQSPEL
ncbi:MULTISPECIES: hypothetical protein [unclassified Chryseobacterium]|uniref:hypothetical protein n=1 Tax=unclassified Chryseobacterium TaxID=2593645 RepID=UPI000F4EE23A|nr:MULTISPECIES: hypothetical protein [unclassified Chryseobacterium]